MTWAKAGTNHFNRTHGLSRSKIYARWAGMKTRCTNPAADSYKDYGARGIKVCDRWKTFLNFYEDMKDSYKEGLWLDRIDNDRDYCKENCRWVTAEESNQNKRTIKHYEYNGKALTIVEWARETGLGSETIRTRLLKWRWPISQALNITPDKGNWSKRPQIAALVGL